MDLRTSLYLKYRLKRRIEIIKNLKRVSVVFLLIAVSIISVNGVSAVVSAKPTVSNFVVVPTTIKYTGGSIKLSATVKNATRCIFRVTPAVSGFNKNIPCRNGRVVYKPSTNLPKNVSALNIVYTFKLIVTGGKHEGTVLAPPKTVTVVAAARPTIKSFTTSSGGLSNAGGTVSLTGQVVNGITCAMSVSPAIVGFGGNTTCNTGSITAYVSLPANSSSSQISYIFTLVVNGEVSSASKALTVIVYSTSTVPTTTTTTTTTTLPPTVGNTIPVPAGPDAMVQAGAYIWVASCKANAVTKINTSTKQIVQILNAPSYGFNCPTALAYDGTHIWVGNNSSLVQLNASTGARIMTLTGPNIGGPIALAIVGSRLWALDPFISVFNTSSGVLVTTIGGYQGGSGWMLSSPTSFASTGTNIWVADALDNSLAEFSGSSGAYLRTTSGGLGLSGPQSVSSHSGYVWVSNSGASLVEEYNASSGAYVRDVAVASPDQIIFTGSDLFVVNFGSTTSVLEYSSTGVFIRTVAKFNQTISGYTTILFDGTSLWVANYSHNTITKYPLQ
jgi:hypothetical protein